MTKLVQRKSFTVEEYHRLAEVGILTDSDRVELINGDIITMSPINSPHGGMVNRLTRTLIKLLGEKNTITVQNPIQIENHSEPEPDLVVAEYREDDYESNHPFPKDIYLIIEVADSTLQKDRTIKYDIYAEAEILEYWIINIPDRQVEIHRQPKNGSYHFKQIISEETEIKASSVGLKLNYSDIFKK